MLKHHFIVAVTCACLPITALAQYPWPLETGPIDSIVEDEIENRVETVTQLNIQENIEDNIEQTVEQTVDETVESSVDDTVASSIEQSLENTLEVSLEASIGDAVEDSVEDSVVGGVEDNVEDAVEDKLVAEVESEVEASVEDAVGGLVEDNVESAVAQSVESSVEGTVTAALEVEVEEGVESAIERTVESSAESELEQRLEIAVERRVESEIDEILDNLESNLDVDESRILKQQWLVMAEASVFEELTSQGYLFDTVTELQGLGLRLAEVAAPSTFDITQVRNGVLDVVGKDRAEVDLNHIYTAGAVADLDSDGVMPRSAMTFPEDVDDLNLRVGMIDSGVDLSHPALVGSKIQARSFSSPGSQSPTFHGTAIASIIAANSPNYKGLAPKAQLFAASVFELDESYGEIASTVSLIRALDWLILSNVDVVNISLAGPPNRLLERALERASTENIVVMAAAGNGGPVAEPMYPAAYDSVVAVTAVDAARKVFRLANRGDYLALSAPGVNVRHAQSGGGYVASSGTSFAVPFAVTAAARLSQLRPREDVVATLLGSAADLGPPGRDSIYGYGLLTSDSTE
ncbi:S8 family serine peptidase [Congregibacter sp.]|uniref:S8 family serine peptidase n=1 Tax=Congregibacter sp. TaxID=2744308 RepID=UPI003F6D377F